MRYVIVSLLVLTVLLCGCQQTARQSVTAPVMGTMPVITTPTEPTEPPDVVSDQAKEAYLLPLTDYSRERKHAPEFVMLHFTSAVMLDRENPFDMEKVRSVFVDYEVSVHYIVARDGSVTCYIPENLVAYHAGYGTWANDPKYTDLLNDYAIGIEIVAIGSQKDMAQYLHPEEYNALDPSFIGYTDAQYEALGRLVRDICTRNNIPVDRDHIIGHQEYSPQKNDPGELFDWDRLLESMK